MRLFKRKQKPNVDIVPKGDILHNDVRFLKGKKYSVHPTLAQYFRENGWLEADTPPPVSLNIDNGRLGHEGGF